MGCRNTRNGLHLPRSDPGAGQHMLEYLQHMFDLALRKELQGIHFWATLYVLIVLAGTLWHALRVRGWPRVEGQLLDLGIRPLGTPELGTCDQDYVPSALYRYQVNGRSYEGREISIWKMSASGMLRNTAKLLPRQVRPSETGKVPVSYHPRRPQKSVLLRPGWTSIALLSALMVLTVAFYVWRW
jgi:Protein of unknown function (DUF3592)